MDNTSNNDRLETKIITLTAFLIGFSLIDVLDSSQQGAVGNFFMLIGQTLCTASAENYRKQVKNTRNDEENGRESQDEGFKNNYSKKKNTSKDNDIELLNKTKEIFDREINKLNNN